MNVRLPHPLQVRIGIHTGLVVVGEIGGGSKREQLALGDTPHIVARIQGLAAPDTVVISSATYRLVQGLFECQTLGSHMLKGRRQVEGMIAGVMGGEVLPQEVVEQVVSKTDEVPLFVEELTKMVLESGLLQKTKDRYELTGPLPPLAIPATLQDSLIARLDRLSTVREVAQLRATLGREFTYELLEAVWPGDQATLQRGLAQLVEAELLYQRGLLPPAREIGEQFLRLAHDTSDPAFLLEAHYALGVSLTLLGEFSSARAHLEQSAALYNPQQHHAHAFLYGLDPGVTSHTFAPLALWVLGYPDQALAMSRKGLALAQQLSHPHSSAFALVFAAFLYQLRQEEKTVQELVETAIALSREQGFPLVGSRNYFLGLGAGRAGAGRGRNRVDTPGSDCVAGESCSPLATARQAT